jgi:hypothetical protein
MKTWSALAFALGLSVALGGQAAADWRTAQPQLTRALGALQVAKVTLARVSVPDHSGQRVPALRNLTQAIAQVQAEMAYDRAHPDL